MPEPTCVPIRLCASEALRTGEAAVCFDVRDLKDGGQSVPAFATRAGQTVVAYLNRCAHVPTQMDWQPGQFWDAEKRHLICAMHGALYEPASGTCVSGPCRGARLQALALREEGGEVYWYPTERFQPLG
jgi:nitrite reductase/ring-hydroxylating ferredoxin subunit